MNCTAPFVYSVSDTIITSSQSSICEGSVTIPGYSTPSVTSCVWWSCGTWKKTGDCSCKDSETIPGIEIWPDIYVAASATVNTTFGTDAVVSFTTSGPSQDFSETITIDSVDITLTALGVTSSFTIADEIELEVSSSGAFSASILLLPVEGDFEGAKWTLDTTLILCPEPSGGTAWLNLQCSISLSYEGYSTSVSFEMPITG
jgi:hypothetical protein